ncbi:MAG: SDR family NAD(P)-dependent oxidoreductase [Pseudobdellovibrionaceae bacterium]|jgi:nucleoside-diphosphate-sugar epimerase
MSQEAVVITGAAGFIGSHLVRRFLAAGYNVIGLDNFSSSDKATAAELSLNKKFIFFKKDCCEDWSSIQDCVARNQFTIKQIFHFASIATPVKFEESFQEIFNANTLGLRRSLEFARDQDARVFFASSSEVYGRALRESLQEEDLGLVNTVGPRAIYDESKRAGEALLYSWNQRYGTSHSIFRIFNTYGPGMHPQDGRAIVDFLSKIQAGQPINLFGDGKQTRSFCYISDLIDQISDLSKKSFLVLNVGSDHEVTLLELIESIKKLTGAHLKINSHPARPEDPQKRKPDLERMRGLMGPQKLKSLQEGLGLYWSYLNQKGETK